MSRAPQPRRERSPPWKPPNIAGGKNRGSSTAVARKPHGGRPLPLDSNAPRQPTWKVLRGASAKRALPPRPCRQGSSPRSSAIVSIATTLATSPPAAEGQRGACQSVRQATVRLGERVRSSAPSRRHRRLSRLSIFFQPLVPSPKPLSSSTAAELQTKKSSAN